MSSIASISQWTQNWATDCGIPLLYEDEVDSTNDWAKERAHTHQLTKYWQIYITDHQRTGHGRNKRIWYNGKPGTCFLASFACKQSYAPSYLLPARLGLILYEAFVSVWPELAWRFKAPNDIYLGGGKIAGLLVELLQKGENYYLIVGLGINVLNKPKAQEPHMKSRINCFTRFFKSSP